ncbi:MAG: hypothetical protein K5739_01810 [Lachnospiraceae bacterium]|nr:hypothetical protein [Lachnospiraceae bacterium]
MSIYLVDYENTGIKGVKGIERLSEEDKLVIFYGPKTGSVPFEDLVKITATRAKLEFIRTMKTAKNYLDFQLVTYVGYLVAKDPSQEYFVISKDSGFDSVVDFWSEKNIRISRFINLDLENAETKEAKSSKTESKNTRTRAASKTGKTKENSTRSDGEAKDRQEKKSEHQNNNRKPQNGQNQNKTAKTKKQESGNNAPEQEAPKTDNTNAVPTVPESVKKKIRTAFKEEGLRPGAYRKLYACMLESNDKATFNTALVHAFTQEIGNKYYKLALPAFSGWK